MNLIRWSFEEGQKFCCFWHEEIIITEMCHLHFIATDVWIRCFLFLNIKDFISIRSTCKEFCTLTDHSRYKTINTYWKDQCHLLCINTRYNDFKVENWKNFYQILTDFFEKCSIFDTYNNKRNFINYNCDQSPRRPNSISIEKTHISIDQNIVWSINYDNLDVFKLLLNSTSFDINAETGLFSYYHPLIWCADKNAATIAQYLLGFDNEYMDVISRFGRLTPLITGCYAKNAAIVSVLLKHEKMTKCILNYQSMEGATALHAACIHIPVQAANRDVWKICSLLLNDDRIDVNKQDYQGNTPLMLIAMQSGGICNWNKGKIAIEFHSVVIKVGLTLATHQNVDINIQNDNGKTALDLAQSNKYPHNEFTNLLKQQVSNVKIDMQIKP